MPPSEDIRELLEKWYVLDRNSVPACMVLEDLKTMDDKSYWDEALPKLIKYLEGLVFDENHPMLLIGHSVTEWEVKVALNHESDSACSRFFWLHRDFKGGVPETAERHWDFYDGHDNPNKKEKLVGLKQWMRDTIPLERVVDFSEASFESFATEDETWQTQFHAWEKKVEEVLSGSLEEVIAHKKAWDENGAGNRIHLSIFLLVQILTFINDFSFLIISLTVFLWFHLCCLGGSQGWVCLARRLRRCCTTPNGPPSR